jgi:hypothetical protein
MQLEKENILKERSPTESNRSQIVVEKSSQIDSKQENCLKRFERERLVGKNAAKKSVQAENSKMDKATKKTTAG